MLNNCGYAVFAFGKTAPHASGLYPQQQLGQLSDGYKPNTFPRFCSQFFQQFVHCISAASTTVKRLVFPAFHTPNKNNKDFFYIIYYLFTERLCKS